MPPGADIAHNLQTVRRRIDAAAQRVGRDPTTVRLVAVSKTFTLEHVRAAAAAGQRAFGENRVQEGLEKIEGLDDLALEWHLIGHLQSNKAKRAAAKFGWIESVDSLDLLEKVDGAATQIGTRPQILVQVDLAGEATKHGADESAVTALVSAATTAQAVELHGLMIVPPYPDRPEDSRPWFRRLKELRDRLVEGGIAATALSDLSMGMSHDFEIAIEEGATIVRVGTAIFGPRQPDPPQA